MVSKCANPACSASFHSLAEGRLFQLSSDDPRLRAPDPGLSGQKKPCRKVEFFWLCAECSKRLTIQLDANRRARTAPLATGLEESGSRVTTA